MKFVAIDVETANPDLASICQIGVVAFEAGQVSETWQSFIDPEDYFYWGNTSIHGIRKEDVFGAPTLPQIHERLKGLLGGQVVAHHSAFDRLAFGKVISKYQLPEIDCTWVDTVKVARRAWPAFAAGGYGLANLAGVFAIAFQHHAAHEDARVAGEIFQKAITDTGLTVSDWVNRIGQPINLSGKQTSSRQGNTDGPLAGETVVFTGALSFTRRKIADLAAEAGCDVASGVTKQTTSLVVGDQDTSRLAGQEKSSKHCKAEELLTKGQVLRILGESDFLQLVELARGKV